MRCVACPVGAQGVALADILLTMFDHISMQSTDVDAAAAFYTAVLGPIGVHEVMRFPRGSSSVVGLAGADGTPRFWIGPATEPIGRELHLAFTAADRGRVQAVHEAATAFGAEVLHAPREWPEYHEGYYGVFVRDLDGNNVEAVCHRPE